MNGPLFTYSNYCMEDNVGHMVTHVKGTTDVATQISTKYILEKNLAIHLKKSPRAQEFYNCIERRLTFPIAHKINESLVIGKILKNHLKNMNEGEMSMVKQLLNLEEGTEIHEYNSIHLKCRTYFETEAKSSTKRTNDSFIFNTESESFADIKAIFTNGGEIYLLINEKYESDRDGICDHIMFLKEKDTYEQKIIKPIAIGQKHVLIKFQRILACSKFPNLYEKN